MRTTSGQACSTLLALAWTLNCTPAHAQPCNASEYRRVKFKGTLAVSASQCPTSSNGVYIEHNNPAVFNGAIAYKLRSSTVTRYLWWRKSTVRYIMSPGVNNGVQDLYVLTSARDIQFLTSWTAWCGMSNGGWKTFSDAMTISEDGSVCAPCPPNSVPPGHLASIAACQCNPGFTGPDGGECAQCVAGKYKTAAGSAACTECLAGQYSTAVGAASNVCQECGANAQSPAGSDESTQCTCESGYTGIPGGPCVACDAGKYKNEVR